MADNVRELKKLQEELPGVVADIYRVKKEGQRPSEKQFRQGCAEFQLFCQRWDSLRIGQTPGEEEASLPQCHTP